jgi:hypothetical protein
MRKAVRIGWVYRPGWLAVAGSFLLVLGADACGGGKPLSPGVTSQSQTPQALGAEIERRLKAAGYEQDE